MLDGDDTVEQKAVEACLGDKVAFSVPETAKILGRSVRLARQKTADGKLRWGAGVDTNIEIASVRAVLSALNRS